MKKALIAMSVAAGLAGVAHAANTTTLYGTIGYEVQYSHAGTTYSGRNNNYKDQWDLVTDDARFGIKGTEDLNNGLQAFYNISVDVDSNGGGANHTRYAYVGLKGDFGTLTLGKQDTVYKVFTNSNDILEDVFFDDAVHYGYLTGGSRPSKVISYVTPDMGGLTLAAATILDGAHEASNGIRNLKRDGDTLAYANSKNFTAAQVGAKYTIDGFTGSLAYSWASFNGKELREDFPNNDIPASITSRKQANVLGANVNYANDQFYIGAGYEHAYKIGNKYNLAGQYFYGPNTFQAGFGVSKSEDLNYKDSVYTYALGYNYNFTKDTYTFVNAEYQHASNGKENGFFNSPRNLNNNTNNGYVVKVGINHIF